ncbi:MAG TPA: HNH endonuclease, partial [Haliangium sp.]|nr:HNH endonuclease [Haliangium sp.]
MREIVLVPLMTRPPATSRTQRHRPKSARDYQRYRPCLRWDAGFTCCFCLVHESDLAPVGVERTAQTSIEHIEPQAHAPHLADKYENCAYACRFCNSARGTFPTVHPSGARLLHPWQDAWGVHFRLHEDRLEPVQQGDEGRHASYTAEVYQINDETRIRLRQKRRAVLMDRMRWFAHDVDALEELASRQSSPEDRLRLILFAQELVAGRQAALIELGDRTAIPPDAPANCRCDSREHHALPPEIEVWRVSLG